MEGIDIFWNVVGLIVAGFAARFVYNWFKARKVGGKAGGRLPKDLPPSDRK